MNKNLRRAQYFTYGKWTGGLYSTSTILGSRPGALIACTWSSMVTMGLNGYQIRTQQILEATQKIANEVQKIPGLYLLGGQPKAMIVCFSSKICNIYHVADLMTKKGWSLNSLQNPACLHLCVTLLTAKHADSFISDLSNVVASIKVEDGPTKKTDGTAAIYGMAGSMPAGPVNELLKVYNDVVLSC
jgi:sphinganine-1-phosphate aldolase